MDDKVKQPTDQSLVLYTDGGSRWHLGGVGIHGYLYNEAISKTFHGHRGYVATKGGYKPKSNGTIPVNVLKYVDFTASVPNCTNNMAETTALVEALQYIWSADLKEVYFLLDSEYVLKGVNEWRENWKRNNWRKNDGEEVSNKDIWIRIDSLLTDIDKRGTNLHWTWVKGHSEDLGNDKADMLATQSIFRLRKHQLMTLSTQHSASSIGVWVVSEPKGYWVPKTDYNRLLCQPRVFIDTNLTDSSPLIDGYSAKYYMTNVGGDDALFGKPSPRGSYAVLYAKERVPVLDILYNAHFEARQYMAANLPIHISPMALIRMHEVLKPSTFHDITTNGSSNLLPIKDRADLYDTKMNNLTYELRSSLAYDGEAILAELETILKTFLTTQEQNGSELVYTDFFDEFYERTEASKKTTTKLKETIGEEGFLDLPCQFRQGEEGLKTTTLRLVIGVDVPTRNTLAAIANDIVSIGVLTWTHPSSRNVLRYGLFIKTDADAMFWAAHYSNSKILKNSQ